MSYTNTFVTISADCPATMGQVPVGRGGKKSIAQIEYELLSAHPYQFTENELIFEVHIRHKQLPQTEVSNKRDTLWNDLFKKSHPCMRASMLPKRYGWGVHYDTQGRIAIYSADSKEYAALVKGKKGAPLVVPAMRNNRIK